jgi:hypothetical protein
VTSTESALLNKLRGAAALQTKPKTAALDFLTGSWDRPAGLFARQSQPAPTQAPPPKAHTPGKRRTIYLDEQAEDDLQFLLDGLKRELGQATRSEGVRRALRAARLATERRRPWSP